MIDTVTIHTAFFSPQAMSSPEDKAYEIMRELDVSYVLVIFGGLTGYASDGEWQLLPYGCCQLLSPPLYRYQQVSVDGSYWW